MEYHSAIKWNGVLTDDITWINLEKCRAKGKKSRHTHKKITYCVIPFDMKCLE